jgi:hypothetical protein
VAGLAALAGQGGQGWAFEADAADVEVGELLDPGCSVVEVVSRVASRRPWQVDRSGWARRQRVCSRWRTVANRVAVRRGCAKSQAVPWPPCRNGPAPS